MMVALKRAANPFLLKEYTYLDKPMGLQARDLRSFLHIVREVPDSVLRCHTMQCYLRPGFDVVDYPNEFASWAAYGLEDYPMAEAFSALEPYRAGGWRDVRDTIEEMVEERLWDRSNGHQTPVNRAFHFQDSVNFVLETGMRAWTLADLRESLSGASLDSVYYHFHEAHQRQGNPDGAGDDFSAWIEDELEAVSLAEAIRSIDFPCYSLSDLKQAVIDRVDTHLEGENHESA